MSWGLTALVCFVVVPAFLLVGITQSWERAVAMVIACAILAVWVGGAVRLACWLDDKQREHRERKP